MPTLAPTTIGAATLALALVPVAVELVQPATDLRPSESIQARLQQGEEQRFHVTLRQGEHVAIPVEQDGIDVAVHVEDPDGRTLAEFQDDVRRHGVEHVDIVADRGGTYTLVIAAATGSTAAGVFSIRMAPAAPATATDRLVQQWHTLQTEGRLLERTGRYTDARVKFEQAVSVAESLAGHEAPEVGRLLFELAGNALETQDNQRYRTLYERADAIFEGRPGDAVPYALAARSRLALLDERQGRSQKGDADLRQLVPLLEHELGPAHPWYLQSLVTLANVREDAGDLDRAEQIDRDALDVLGRTDQRGTILEAQLLNNLGDILRRRGADAQAESLFRQSLAIGEALRGPDSLFVATEVLNLGILARERKDYPAAIALYTRALSIRERLLGRDDATLAGPLTNLANVFRATGNDAKALETHFRALRLWEKSSGPNGRDTLLAAGNIARTYAGMGDVENALMFQRRADAILEAQMGFYVAIGSERQKLAFVRTQAERTDRTISLHLRQAPERADAARLAALVLLQRKGRVQDAMTDLYASVRQRLSTPADRALIDDLKETNAALARVAFGGPPGGEEARESLAAMEARREQIETVLSDRSSEFRADIRPVTLEAVQAVMPSDAVLLEFAVFHPFDPGAESNRDAYGPPHYAAYVVHKDGPPVGFDLGAVADIDPLVSRLRAALRNPSDAGFATAGRELDERIMQPLRASLHGAGRLLVSPDGALNLVPFEALIDEHGRFLIERYATTYVTSGRDLVRMQTRRAPAGRPVIVADPLFGEPARPGRPAERARSGAAQRSVIGGNEIARLYFAPLSGSAIEGAAIRSLFPDATLLTGKRATKANLERLSGPGILHIASHGFFLDDALEASGAMQNPLLRSGLALAGANRRDPVEGGGILTALEAAGLDLRGTGLVTLSACDTGSGVVLNGEGVYGLRRAFTLAGAESLVMTLWPVDDGVARNTMVAYYTRLRRGAGRGDALRLAKLAMMNRPGMRHPYYWATFIHSGNWTRLPVAGH